MKAKIITFMDLFSGFRFIFTLKKMGLECIRTYDINNKIKIPRDILTYDILCACFSMENHQRFLNIITFIENHKPKIIIIENAKELCNHDGGNTLKKIKNDIEKEDYTITYKVLRCSDGLPKMSKILFIVCVRNDIEIAKMYNDVTIEAFLKNVITQLQYIREKMNNTKLVKNMDEKQQVIPKNNENYYRILSLFLLFVVLFLVFK